MIALLNPFNWLRMIGAYLRAQREMVALDMERAERYRRRQQRLIERERGEALEPEA